MAHGHGHDRRRDRPDRGRRHGCDEGAGAGAIGPTLTALERSGIDALWFRESPGSESLSMAAILLAQSTTLRVATGIANIAARAPSAMAAGRRILDEAYPGRFVLGLGVSHDSIIDAYAGRSWAARWQHSSATWI